jgi:hypothetical protein
VSLAAFHLEQAIREAARASKTTEHVGLIRPCDWLKGRRSRVLSEEDIRHYERIVVAISETIRLMGEIDEVIEAHGGWPLPSSVAG